ncbi:amidohydrolase [Paenibacillus lautus]|uniref:amidohydrolase family protein n=1 Tax=Paenibacillus lautus TaxID=1401 RepID=UPI001B266A8E|nr:amidohydrolase family protein [Paenibacillus lautus]GIO99585.1 amidohydrolase [Paenibacillus lautus]
MTIKSNSKKYLLLMVMALGVGLFGNAGPSHASIEPSNKNKQTLVLQNATVVDVQSGKLEEDQTIIVVGNKIQQIGDSDEVEIPGEAQVRDAAGQYVIPGLWDMHIHLMNDHKLAFPLFLSNGVTGVRDMGANLKSIDLWKKAIRDGMNAPRIAYAGSTLVQGEDMPHLIDLRTEKQAREAVRLMAKKGADHIKVYSWLPRPLFIAAADEANKLGLPVTGHLPALVRATEAVRVGMKSMEHLNGMFIATSSLEEDLLKNPKLMDMTTFVKSEIRAAKSYDPKRAAKLFQAFKQNEVWQVPTLIAMNSLFKTELSERAKYVPTEIQKQWIQAIRPIKDNPKEFVQTREYNSLLPGLVRKMNEAGVPLLAGTDAAVLIPNQVFGFSLHDELELLVKSGLTPLQALQTATLNPAKYLGREHELGTVEEGKLADLVLLAANPLKDIRNTTAISAVILDGKLMEKQDLTKAIKTYQVIKMSDVKNQPQSSQPANKHMFHQH